MIKLNNKNITYVALADSNNSLKAPKEIWYADSSNSVKLVYQRKDALIEGEDYEKYHWLRVETGMQRGYYMLLPMSTNFSFTRKYLSDWSNTWYYWTPNYVYYTDSHKLIEIYDSINRTSIDSGDTSTISIGDTINIISTPDLLLFNGKTINRYNYAASAKFCIYNVNSQIITSLNSAITVNNSMRYIPCKLLKPVPKWLDANGIRRQVGECGMIDLISGKFYGNVANAGTFSVENYYERKEWLKGRNGAYIDTGHKLVAIEDRFECSIRYDGNSVNPDNREQWIFGVWNNNDVIGNYIARADNKLGVLYKVDNQLWCRCTENHIHKFETFVNGSSFYCIDNGLQFSDSTNGLTEKTINSTCYLYACNGLDTAQYFHGDIAYFKITDTSSNTKMNLIPCTLTMDLPASMDANNIARTKGTSGMWDLVSDRFYGNVASSGTFKAVNLAEGVDYEVHQWLIGDGNAYINTLITSYSGIIKVAFKSTQSIQCAIFGREALKSDYTDRLVLLRYYNNGYNVSDLYGIKTSGGYWLPTDLNDEEITIDLDNQIMTNKSGNSVQINVGVNVTGSSVTLFGKSYGESMVNAIAPSDVAIKKFSVSNQINLIPVKLLKSIPSKYDANGIARQAGECGMYDTVNDVFYGNVASSGTFSVSDDS